MKSWFPIADELIHLPEFKKLTTSEKLYFWAVVSEFNLNGPFYKADIDFAALLKLSVPMIRKARRKLEGMGWLTIRPGFQTGGRKIATTYNQVAWSKPPEQGQGRFSQMHRYAFEQMLWRVKENRLTHEEALTYVYLYHHWLLLGDKDGAFYVTKRELNDVTGLTQSAKHVKRLYETFTFSEGSHLFEFQDEYHRLKFSKWSTFADPSEVENNRKIAIHQHEMVKKIAQDLRAKEQEKSSNHEVGKRAFAYFDECYFQKFGKSPSSKGVFFDLGGLVKTWGKERIQKAIEDYIFSDILPQAIATQETRSAAHFIKHAETLILQQSGMERDRHAQKVRLDRQAREALNALSLELRGKKTNPPRILHLGELALDYGIDTLLELMREYFSSETHAGFNLNVTGGNFPAFVELKMKGSRGAIVTQQ